MLKLKRKHQRLLISILVIALALLIGFTQENPELKQTLVSNQPGLYEVEKVSDGDTIIVDMNGTMESVRMIGVDTPETHHPSKPVQCFGRAATAFTTELLGDKKVRLEADPLNSNRDRYQRLLRYVYLPDGTLVNLEIVAQGYGFAYTAFPLSKSEEFELAEDNARLNELGLWADCDVNRYGNGRIETGSEQ